MSRISRSRSALTSAVIASFVLGAALSGASVPIASAADATENCKTSQTRTFNGATSLSQYTLEKEVVGDATVAPGGTVTFRTTVYGSKGITGLIDQIDDFHPEGFQLISARESVWKVLGGQSWTDVTSTVQKDSSSNRVSRTSLGWTVAGDARVSLETKYKVPDTAEPGTVLNSGAAFDIAVVGNRSANPIDTCVTIREPNAMENVTGSLDDLGFGSATTGSTISSDPAGFVSDIINGVDLSKLMGS